VKKRRDASPKSLTAIEGDFETYDFGKAKWDVVTMIYEGTDHSASSTSAQAGGLFITESYFHADTDVAKAGPGG
jgi:hypothetical protein